MCTHTCADVVLQMWLSSFCVQFIAKPTSFRVKASCLFLCYSAVSEMFSQSCLFLTFFIHLLPQKEPIH